MDSGTLRWIERLELRALLAHIATDSNFGNLGDVAVGGSLLVAPVANNKILEVSESKAVRLNADGSVDSTFADPGLPARPKGKVQSITSAFIDGQDVISAGLSFNARSGGGNSLLARAIKLTDGSADTSFGAGGVATIAVPLVPAGQPVLVAQVRNVVATPDGGVLFLVLQGSDTSSTDQTTIDSLVLYKLNSHGALDSTFGTNGQAVVTASNAQSFETMAINPQGKILLLVGDGSSAVVTRYKTNGTVDTTFGTDGMVTNTDLNGLEGSGAIAPMQIQPDGKILFAFQSSIEDSTDYSIVRLKADGSADTAFNRQNPGFTTEEPINDYLVDGSGKIVLLTGEEIVRLDSTGAIDATFDDNGIASIPRDSSASILGVDESGGYFVANSKHTTHMIARDTNVLLPSGVLSVATTEGDDTISLAESGAKLILTINGNATKFSVSQVKSISIEAGGGNNTIDAEIPSGVTISSGGGSDSITTGDGDNSVDSGDGDDIITTGNGDDDISFNGSVTITSNGGNDTIHGDNGLGDTDSNRSFGDQNIQINSGDGNDEISLASTNGISDTHQVTIDGGAGDDHIDSADALGVVHGGDGNDVIIEVGGYYMLSDSLYGDGGNDTIHGGDSPDYLSGGGGKDRLYGEDGTDSIVGGDGNDVIYGDGGDDTIGGQAGNDLINGGKGKDLLGGGTGNDTIFANDANADQLFGDGGHDSASIDNRDTTSSIESLIS